MADYAALIEDLDRARSRAGETGLSLSHRDAVALRAQLGTLLHELQERRMPELNERDERGSAKLARWTNAYKTFATRIWPHGMVLNAQEAKPVVEMMGDLAAFLHGYQPADSAELVRRTLKNLHKNLDEDAVSIESDSMSDFD